MWAFCCAIQRKAFHSHFTDLPALAIGIPFRTNYNHCDLFCKYNALFLPLLGDKVSILKKGIRFCSLASRQQ
jgi:hypothetical protein